MKITSMIILLLASGVSGTSVKRRQRETRGGGAGHNSPGQPGGGAKGPSSLAQSRAKSHDNKPDVCEKLSMVNTNGSDKR